MIINRFESKIEHRTVDTILIQIERAINGQDKYIDLNPIYQRDIIWDDEKQSNFIDSVIKGVIPNNLILNLDTTNGKEICLDGKQRITSLIRFKNNEIPYVITLDDDKEEYYFFDAVPREYSTNPKYKILSQNQKYNFLNKTIIFITYSNLSYDDQVDIFTRIQHGVALSEGEKLGSVILNENVNNKFNEFCNAKKAIMLKFNGTGNKRDQHKIILVNIMNIHKTCKLQVLVKSQRNKFLKDINNETLVKVLNEISPLINFAFSNDVLGNKTISNKISSKVFYSVLFWLNKHKFDLNYKNLIKNKQNQVKLRSVIRKMHRARTKGKLDDIKNKLLNDYKKIKEDDLTDEENEIQPRVEVEANMIDESEECE